MTSRPTPDTSRPTPDASRPTPGGEDVPTPRGGDVHPVCARFHTAIEMIGTRWTGAILRALFTGQCRYAQIKAAIPGMSDTMLAQRLRELQRDGLVERHVLPTTPVQVEYRLTRKGQDLEPVLDAIIAWSHTWVPLPGGDRETDADRTV
ncbi:winged helix-turn-helix transcriptional regulator [Streptomyces sp. GMY02]|uniref:winged helix-turn-helix transcriptional regulator n=1 Tax=Streptomyces sp. GMY02 TaxID=1333528 RepID=UPI002D7F1F9C|nr:helix-turn-helix domain-containing protein [Streptomyces sp. GMY02]